MIVAHVVDAGVAGGVDLDHVDMPALGDGDAGLAPPHGSIVGSPWSVGTDAVERLGDQPCGRGLADTAHPREQEGMRQPPPPDGVAERLHHRILADQLVETLRAIFAGEHAIGLAGGGLRRLVQAEAGARIDFIGGFRTSTLSSQPGRACRSPSRRR